MIEALLEITEIFDVSLAGTYCSFTYITYPIDLPLVFSSSSFEGIYSEWIPFPVVEDNVASDP